MSAESNRQFREKLRPHLRDERVRQEQQKERRRATVGSFDGGHREAVSAPPPTSGDLMRAAFTLHRRRGITDAEVLIVAEQVRKERHGGE